MSNQTANQGPNVTWKSYAIFIFAIIFFSGIFAASKGWLQVFDCTVLSGGFGKLATAAGGTSSFRGAGGTGAKDGFLFALELMPALIFAIGFINVVEGLGGLGVAQKFMTPLLRPLLGIPGVCSLAMIANLQTTDAGAGMTKELMDAGVINDKERSIFAAYQISGSAPLTNYFSSAVAIFPVLLVPIIVPLLVILLFKLIGGNIVRIYLNLIEKKQGGAVNE